MRDYRLIIPANYCAAERDDYHRASLEFLVVKADVSTWRRWAVTPEPSALEAV